MDKNAKTNKTRDGWKNYMDVFRRRASLFIAIFTLAGAAHGVTIQYVPILPSSGAIVTGEWNSNLPAGLAYADANYIPMLAIYGSRTCGHCLAMQTACNTEEFKTWAQEKKIVMIFEEDYATGSFWAGASGNSLPRVAIYWKKPDESTLKVTFSGVMGEMPSKDGNTLEAQLISSCQMYIGAYPQLKGFEYLAFTNSYECARLEAETGKTLYVDVPLVRDSFMKGFAATNSFKAVYKDATLVDKQVIWDLNATEMSVRVDIPAEASAGEEIDVSLKSGDGEDRGDVKIFIVGERENSTKNPLFIGERTAQTLGYGEWTMDLDVAMEKYKSEPESHLMAVASGSLWCPDCVMTDGHVLETEKFKDWAVENKVILVDIDVPNFPNTTNSACLLTRVVCRTSDGYISGRGTLATNEFERFQSGAGYLSRHMVSDADAKAVLERNRSLVGANTLNGGWNNPDRKNQNRTGIPNFFALDRAGAVIGTFETFDAIGPSGFKDAYLKRFSELIALEDGDGSDLPNRSWQTTKDSFSGSGETAGALSAIDLVDTFELASISSEAVAQDILVSGSDSSVTVTVNLIAVVSGTATTVATAKGLLSDGVRVSCTMTPKEAYYVQVVGVAAGMLAVDSDAVDTMVGYTVSGTRTEIANPYSNEWTSKAAKATLPLYAADGTSVSGYLELQLKKDGRVSAKIFDMARRVASLNGAWDGDIAADGTATAALKKGDLSLALTISSSGVVSASVFGQLSMTSGPCALADDYGDWVGNYAIALPLVDAEGMFCGDAYMTLTMGKGKAAVASGKMRYTVFLPDGKKLSGTTGVTGWDANFGVVPVVRTSGVNKFSAALLVRRRAGSAPTRRAVISMDGVKAVWQSSGVPRECGVYGSLVVTSDSLLTFSGTEMLVFVADTAFISTSKYGTLNGITYDGGGMSVSASSVDPAVMTAGFSFKLDRKTGVFKGRTKMSFSNKEKVPATFSGVIMPSWFSDCECQEDNDKVVPMTFLPFGVGQLFFTDSQNGRRIRHSIPVSLRAVANE